MRELVEAIRARGVGVGTDIVKVDMFLNHRLDTDLFVKMGQAFAQEFAQEKPDLVLTVEASGIAAALTTAMACGNIPVVFAKIREYMPEFTMTYELDPLRQAIADSWPDSLDDTCAREEWDWKPEFDLDTMTRDMIKNLRIKFGIEKAVTV